MSEALGYLDSLPFPADRYQREAAAAVDRGESVVVAAPTGSGKTVVAECAVHRALRRGRRAVYTTPLKALSNQKFGDFRRSRLLLVVLHFCFAWSPVSERLKEPSVVVPVHQDASSGSNRMMRQVPVVRRDLNRVG